MLKAVARNGTIETEATILPEKYKKKQIQDRKRKWVEKKMYGQYAREMGDGVDMKSTGRWPTKSDLKGCTEALICRTREQALRTNYTKYHIDKTVDSPLCRMCGEKRENVRHLVSECSKNYTPKEYKRRHHNVVRYIHWELCKKLDLDISSKWYEHKPPGVLEDGSNKILWDFNIQCDYVIEGRRPDIVVIHKDKKEYLIIDIAVPGDARLKAKEQEKVKKYQDLKMEIAFMWNMKRVTVIPVVVGALGAVSTDLEKWIEKRL